MFLALVMNPYSASGVEEIVRPDDGQKCQRESLYRELSVEWIQQQASNWCWAASATTIIKYWNNFPGSGFFSFSNDFFARISNPISYRTPSQCIQVNNRYGETLRANCCDPRYFNPSATDNTGPGTDDCNRGGWPEFNRYGFSFEYEDVGGEMAAGNPDWKGINWTGITYLICRKRPFAYSWRFPNGAGTLSQSSGHMFVGTGFQQTRREGGTTERWVISLDPTRDCTAEPNLDRCKEVRFYPDCQEDPSQMHALLHPLARLL